MDQSTAAPTCKPVGYIPTDAIEKITTPPLLILCGVTVLSYHGEGHTAIYSADQVRAMLAAERERCAWLFSNAMQSLIDAIKNGEQPDRTE